MTTFTRLARGVLIAGGAVVALVFTASFVMIFWGDPEFPPMPEMSAESQAALAASFAQPYQASVRRFAMRDGDTLTAQYFAADSKTTIVLVHGVLASSFPLNRSSGLLREAAGAEVVSIDLRGHGSSSGAPGDTDYIGQYEDDIADVVTSIRAAKPGGRVILAGHSMGGGIALRYAVKEAMPPLDGYLLFAPHLGAKSPTTPMEATEGSAAFVRVHVPRVLGLALFNAVGITAFNGLDTLFFNLPKEFPLRSYSFRAMSSMAPEDHRTALAAIDQPLLVLVGGRDEAFRAERYQAEIEGNSSGRFQMIEGASHDGLLYQETTLEAVRSWIVKQN